MGQKKVPTKRKRMTKLERRIHNEKVLLWARWFATASVASLFGSMWFVYSLIQKLSPVFRYEPIAFLVLFVFLACVCMYIAIKELEELTTD